MNSKVVHTYSVKTLNNLALIPFSFFVCDVDPVCIQNTVFKIPYTPKNVMMLHLAPKILGHKTADQI